MSIRMPTASETRRTALAAGAKLQVCDDGLLLRDGDRLPKQILKSLQKHEQMIIEDVRANESMTSAEDMRLFRDCWKTQSELGGRAGSVCLNRTLGSISGSSAGFRLPRSAVAS